MGAAFLLTEKMQGKRVGAILCPMENVATNLYRSPPEDLNGNGEFLMHAFLLHRDDGRDGGNLLIYSAGQLENDEDHLRELGGITRQYLNHRHEAASHCDWVSQTFGSKLICHEAEQQAIAKVCTVSETFSGAIKLHSDLIAIPTPGHCAGSTCFLWDGPDARYLFTSDTIYFINGDWRVFIEPESAEQMTESLRVIAALEFDVMLPGLYQGDIWQMGVSKAETVERIDEIIGRLQKGELN